jgi:hypothetical protein
MLTSLSAAAMSDSDWRAHKLPGPEEVVLVNASLERANEIIAPVTRCNKWRMRRVGYDGGVPGATLASQVASREL